MLLIYSYTTSPRLQYICNFIFTELLKADFKITIDAEEFKNYEGAKINYSNQSILNDEFRISNVNLLFEDNIVNQKFECFELNDYNAFFKVHNSNIAFDIFAASFYLLSRYEEYLPHTKDMYGRYAHENSLAYKESFLHLPLINIWVNDFAIKLKEFFPVVSFQLSIFNFLPTYDIDMAFSYKHKGVVRNAGSFLKSPSAERIKVLSGFKKDPFDSFTWLNEIHNKFNLQPFYFFLVAQKNSLYDKNILPHKNIMWRLIKYISKKYKIGIHPSWQSGDDDLILKKEIELLQEMVSDSSNSHQSSTINFSRQHYIRFNLPEGYQRLIDVGITDDYSMGYGSINGFRASVASSFFWYDLKNELQTNLRIHPFCFMEANSFYEQKFTANQAFDELMNYYKVCKKVKGTLITIWHNNFLGTDKGFIEWKNMYEKFIGVVNSEL